MESVRATSRISLALLAVAAGISIWWGVALERGPGMGVMGFPGIYFGTKCLAQGGDPYNAAQLQQIFDAAGFNDALSSSALRQAVILYVNLPPTFLFVAPFALLPLGAAKMLWLVLLVGCFLLASYLMWRNADRSSRSVSLLLTFIVLANCEILFSGGNTAGFVVSLCVIATWCFLQDRYVAAGIICMAFSLAMKPHDGGLVWLYFLLAGPVQRKRAMRACILSLILVLISVLWVSWVAPHWLPELRTNLATISSPGGINEPGPTSIGVTSPDMIIDLQTVVSLFAGNPGIYNAVTYSVCSLVLAVWLIAVLRTSKHTQNAWFALVSAAALSMLVTYHRSYDARLLLLSIPACAILWAEGGPLAWVALLLTSAGILFTADIPLAALMHLTRGVYSPSAGAVDKAWAAIVTRPAPLALLAIAVFYLVMFMRRTSPRNSAQVSIAAPLEP